MYLPTDSKKMLELINHMKPLRENRFAIVES